MPAPQNQRLEFIIWIVHQRLENHGPHVVLQLAFDLSQGDSTLGSVSRTLAGERSYGLRARGTTAGSHMAIDPLMHEIHTAGAHAQLFQRFGWFRIANRSALAPRAAWLNSSQDVCWALRHAGDSYGEPEKPLQPIALPEAAKP